MGSSYAILGHKKIIPIVTAADDDFSMPLAVMLLSSITGFSGKARNSAEYSLQIYVLDLEISKENKQKLKMVCESTEPKKDVTVSFVPIEITRLMPHRFARDKDSYLIPTTSHLGPAVLARLYIPELFYRQYDKIIYLDGDLLIQGDIVELWEIDIGDYQLAACREENTYYIDGIADAKICDR
uniref:Glycosyl transferase family 8 n=1 Tax=Candidatus Kentrum sp. LFY TaxID=2126342 RepID=A0A450V1W5_9GAMM|nr:MAG: Glycosyl transferase family 8 [Candidatus Kentron sp. LFY]